LRLARSSHVADLHSSSLHADTTDLFPEFRAEDDNLRNLQQLLPRTKYPRGSSRSNQHYPRVSTQRREAKNGLDGEVFGIRASSFGSPAHDEACHPVPDLVARVHAFTQSRNGSSEVATESDPRRTQPFCMFPVCSTHQERSTSQQRKPDQSDCMRWPCSRLCCSDYPTSSNARDPYKISPCPGFGTGACWTLYLPSP
jgi:hypothetical protein